MADRTNDRDKHGVENVAGEGNPGGGHQAEEVLVVLARGLDNIELRGEEEELIRRLQGVDDGEVEGEGKDDCQEEQADNEHDVATGRTVGTCAGMSFQNVGHLLFSHPSQ